MAILSHLHRHERGGGLINLTPMIDVTFLLLTFFMLATHFASVERTEVELPRPDHNQAVDRRFPEKVTINMVFEGEDRPPAFAIGPGRLDSLATLAARLNEVGRTNPDTQVILRADRRLPYGLVRQVMEVITAQNLIKLQVVTEMP